MKAFEKKDITSMKDVISNWQNENKTLISNFFGFDDNEVYEISVNYHTVIIRKKEYNYYRLFVISSDASDLKNNLKELDNSEYVINIPSKKAIDEWNEILTYSDFTFYSSYSRYVNATISTMRKIDTPTNTLASLNQVDEIYDLLYSNFSTYTGHLPSRTEIEEMIERKNIYIDMDNGKVCGVNIFTITGPNAYGNAWIDTGTRGLSIFLDVFNALIDNNVKRFIFWVDDKNTKVIRMHKIQGAKPDGLKDYTYIKNKK